MKQENNEVLVREEVSGRSDSKKAYIKPEMKAHEPLERSATVVYYYYT